MGMPIAILPDADRGMPRWGVAPSHVQGARIGIGAPLAVAQPQARQRHTESAACPSHARFRVRPPPKCHGHSWIGTGTRFRRSKQTPRKPGRTPYREAVDHRFRGRGRERGPEFGDPRQAALETAVPLDHALVHAADGLFDPVDLAADPAAGRGCHRAAGGTGRRGPVAEDLLCPLELPAAPDDRDGLDRPVPLPERAPEFPVGAAPGMERRRRVVARIGVDEHRAPASSATGSLRGK